MRPLYSFHATCTQEVMGLRPPAIARLSGHRSGFAAFERLDAPFPGQRRFAERLACLFSAVLPLRAPRLPWRGPSLPLFSVAPGSAKAVRAAFFGSLQVNGATLPLRGLTLPLFREAPGSGNAVRAVFSATLPPGSACVPRKGAPMRVKVATLRVSTPLSASPAAAMDTGVLPHHKKGTASAVPPGIPHAPRQSTAVPAGKRPDQGIRTVSSTWITPLL